MVKKVPCGLPGFRCYRAHNNTFMRLSVQDDASGRCCEHHRNYSKVFLTVNDNCCRRMGNRMINGTDQVISQRSRRIFYLNAFPGTFRHPAAWGSHRISVDNRNCWPDPVLLEVVSDDIADGIYRVVPEHREDLYDVPVKFSEWFLEESPVLFGKDEHQRTFSA